MRRNILGMGVAVLALSFACTTTKQERKRGELVLYLQTDLSIPDDVSSIRVEVVKTGRVQFAQTYLIGPSPLLEVPATLSLVAGDDPSEPVSIRVLARQVAAGADGDVGIPRVLREIVTTVPPDRSALLPITLQWLCTDEKSLTVKGDEVSNACGEGETCVAGSCEPQAVDSSTLPDFDARIVEGTAPESGCFDALACLAGAGPAPVDLQSCTVVAPAGDRGSWNFGLRLPLDSGGDCDGAHCYVPLNEGTDGWQADDRGRVQLPRAICETGSTVEVVASAACPSKTELMPVCGPATRFQERVPGTPGAGGGQGGAGVGGAGPVGGGEPEVVLLKGVPAPRHVIVDPVGVFFLAKGQGNSDAVFWCSGAGCESQAQVQWQGPPGAMAQGFARNSTQLTVWGWDQQSIQIHACPFPGGCSTGTATIVATSSSITPPAQPPQGMIAMTEKSVIFREVEPSPRIQTCSMLDTGCGAAAATLFTDTSAILSLTTGPGILAWANQAGEIKHCDLNDCPGTVAVDATAQAVSWGPVVTSDTFVWSSDRVVRACAFADCPATTRDLFNAASPLTALAGDGSFAYFGFLRVPQPPVHDLVKVPLDGSGLGQTLRSGDGILGGTGVEGDFVYSFVVDPTTMTGDLVRTAKTAMPMMPAPMP